MLALLAFFSLAVMSCNDDDNGNDQANMQPYTISGDASGSQMVPAVSGTGTGTISGTYDPKTRQLNYTSNWNGLTGAPTSAGFYSGASGSAGTAVGTPWTIASGSTETGSLNGTMTLTEDQAKQFTNGGWYYSYGTSTNPTGEVRGQITATQQAQSR
jgi:hypothetical protein